MVFFRGLVVGHSGSFHNHEAGVCWWKTLQIKQSIPARKSMTFLLTSADLHTKTIWNEIFFGVVTGTRLCCSPLGACCCNHCYYRQTCSCRLSEDLRTLSDPLTAMALFHHASIMYVHLLRWEQTGDRRQAGQLIRYLDGPRTSVWWYWKDWNKQRCTFSFIHCFLSWCLAQSQREKLRPANKGQFQLRCIISFFVFLFFKAWQVRL